MDTETITKLAAAITVESADTFSTNFVLPTPSGKEEQQDYISRCMGNDTMVKEFPKQEQRAAVCYAQWRKSKK